MIKNLVTVSFTAIVIAAMLVIYNYNATNSAMVSTNELVKTVEKNAAEADFKTPRYIIKVLDGYLAVYVPTSAKPVQLTDIDMRSLRLNDQKIIAKGVPIYSEQQLCEFLEDFGS